MQHRLAGAINKINEAPALKSVLETKTLARRWLGLGRPIATNQTYGVMHDLTNAIDPTVN